MKERGLIFSAPTAPVRIQLSRRKGWRMPENTVKVSRPHDYGNIFVVNERIEPGKHVGGGYCIAVPTIEDAIACHALMWERIEREQTIRFALMRSDLRGKNLACWCRLCEAHKDGKPLGVECKDCAPCHADVLLELANKAAEGEAG